MPGDGKALWRTDRQALSTLHPANGETQIASTACIGDPADMAVPPGNRLEALKADRAGQHSIRINDQWRICFRWLGSDAHDVEIVDYH